MVTYTEFFDADNDGCQPCGESSYSSKGAAACTPCSTATLGSTAEEVEQCRLVLLTNDDAVHGSLGAIGILALSKDEERNKIIHDAINRLGRTDLHSALTALQNIDVGDDELVYQMVAKYIDKPVVEYQILCAWLLRKRYGTTAAKHLVKLLTHSETRVHKYALKIFAERQVDVHLITEIIEVLRRHWSALKSWHKINLIKVYRYYKRRIVENPVKSRHYYEKK